MEIDDTLFQIYQDQISKEDVKLGPSEEEFPYSNTYLIDLPLQPRYAWKIHRFFFHNYNKSEYPESYEMLFKALLAFLKVLRKNKDAQYFISRRVYDIPEANPRYYTEHASLQIVVYGDMQVKKRTKYVPFYQSKQFQDLLNVKYGWTEPITCVQLQSRSQFFDLLHELVYNHHWIESSETSRWPFYAWTNKWL